MSAGHGHLDRPDRELVADARAGDRDALEVLLRRHHQRIHLLCHRMCADRGDAEDATQEALVAIVRGLPRFDGRAEFTTWSYRVATNSCLDQLRRRSRRPLPRDLSPDGAEADVAPLTGSSGATGADHAQDPAERAVAAEQRSTLQAALCELPEHYRVPVVLRDVADLDYAEIAELLDLPPGTVRSRIARGRRRLADALGIDAEPDAGAEGHGNQRPPAQRPSVQP